MNKWRSKITGQELAWVRDGWDREANYYITFSFTEVENTDGWIRLSFKDFVEAFERVSE